ncbi:MAG: hypothetical protein JXD22_05435 [Sedimentisphaerales bacterium]|nr:hypothetical protein [Sedimentisphaerales bacterium]
MFIFSLIRKSFICLLLLILFPSCAHGISQLDDYNVVWDSPSKDYNGSMPLGNGDISLNAWVEPSGDLVFYIGKTDSWGDNSRLLKVGKIRVILEPNPFNSSKDFRQTLHLNEGTMLVQYGKDNPVMLKLWVDANHPVIHITAQGQDSLTATARIELWRTERYELPSLEVSDIHLHRGNPENKHAPTFVEPDTVLTSQNNRIGWFHHNKKSVGPELTMQIQGLSDYPMVDPILHRTFGAVVTAKNAQRRDDLTLSTSPAAIQQISIYVLTKHPSQPNQWLAAMDHLIKTTEQISFQNRRAAHVKWWNQFWNRSWIFASEDHPSQTALMAKSSHPVRIGQSQHGSELFKGKIVRASIFNKALTDKQVEALAADDKDLIPPQPGMVGCWTNVAPGKTLDNLTNIDQSQTLTLEAWIQPESLPPSGARILDKTTPGGSDGFLLDTYPGNSLRLITKAGTLTQKDILTASKWHHVAAVIDATAGILKLFHNGKIVAQQMAEAQSGANIVTRGYILQRFINACAGRGAYPIKFNGTIFTVPNPGSPGDADYRRWGPGYWWQNTRLPYLSMCTSGDFDLLQPLFKMYAGDVFEISKYRTRHYFGHPGAYYPECINFWGTCFTETYGWTPFEDRQDKLQTSGWHKWEWVCGPELVCLMLDYYEHTENESFLQENILPLAKEVMLFFENYYQLDNNGKLLMHPSQALETWWDCTNPMPEVAGLRAISRRILELPSSLLPENARTYWQTARKKIPEIPIGERDGIRMLIPAEKYAEKRNVENPELYAVYPFRQFALGKPNIELAMEAFNHRGDKGNFGWRQEEIFMAYLGLSDQARDNLVGRAKKKHAGSRFPAFWGPNYDWVPDQDHGGVLLKAFQSMLMQTDGKIIYLLPAWPKEWDVDFKLHAPYKTVIEGKFINGKLIDLKVTPPSRKSDIIIMTE